MRKSNIGINITISGLICIQFVEKHTGEPSNTLDVVVWQA